MHGPGGGGADDHDHGSEWATRTGGTVGTAGAALVGYGIWVLLECGSCGSTLPALAALAGLGMLGGGTALALRGAH